MTHHVSQAGDNVPASRPLVTQADRFHWQRAATRELAAILEAHLGLPAITWTIGPAGALSGRINGLTASAAEVRTTFAAWRDALGLNEPPGQPADDSPVTHLRASARRGTVSAAITDNVFPDDPAPDAAGQHGAASVTRTAPLHAGPMAQPRPNQRTQPGHTI
jgi:hypothetical protein